MKRLGPWSFYRQALTVAVPVIAQAFLMSLVSLVDNFMVAGLGDARMAGVNVANQLNFVYLVVLGTIAGSGGIFLAQFNGAASVQGMQQAFRFKTLVSLGLGGLWFAACQLIPELLMTWMTQGNSAQAELVFHGAGYLRTVSWSFLPMAWVSAGASSLRDIGRARGPLVFAVAAALLNTLGNWFLIEGQLGAPRWELQGAALATVGARLVEALLLTVFLFKRRPAFMTEFRRFFQLDKVLWKAIFRRSWMMLVSEVTWVLSETVTSAIYNGRGGSDLVAGLAAGWTLANLFFSVFGGLHVATGVLVGASLGADRLEEARQRARWILNGSWILGLVFAAAQALSVLAIPLVFSNLSAEARAVSTELLLVICLYLPLWVLINAQFALSRAGGDALMGFLVDMITTFFVFMPLVFGLSWLTPWSAVWLFALAKLSDFAKIAIAWWWLKKEHWVRNLTRENAV